MNLAFIVWLPRPKRRGTWMTWGRGGHALQCGEAEVCCGGRTHVGVFGHALGMGGHALWCSDTGWGWLDTGWGGRTRVWDGRTRVGVFGHGLGMGGHMLGMGGHTLGMVGHVLGWADTGLGWADMVWGVWTSSGVVVVLGWWCGGVDMGGGRGCVVMVVLVVPGHR
jgi:hypothetical protein